MSFGVHYRSQMYSSSSSSSSSSSKPEQTQPWERTHLDSHPNKANHKHMKANTSTTDTGLHSSRLAARASQLSKRQDQTDETTARCIYVWHLKTKTKNNQPATPVEKTIQPEGIKIKRNTEFMKQLCSSRERFETHRHSRCKKVRAEPGQMN